MEGIDCGWRMGPLAEPEKGRSGPILGREAGQDRAGRRLLPEDHLPSKCNRPGQTSSTAAGKITEIDPWQAKAGKVMSLALITAGESHRAFERRFGFAPDWEPWRFFVTVACVHASLLYLGKSVPRGRFLALHRVVLSALADWDSQGEKFLEDSTAFLERASNTKVRDSYNQTEKSFALGDTLAVWVVWNVHGHRPEGAQEWEQVRSLGLMITYPFRDWWTVD